MANKRMFSMTIVDTDAFLDMPQSSQLLYFHLNMRADDDGFVGNVKRLMRTIGSSEDDLKILLAKKYVLGFESGVIVIKHWRIHNTLRKDRYNETTYLEEKAELNLKDNNSYTLTDQGVPLVAKRLPGGCLSIEENRVEKSSIDIEKSSASILHKNKDIKSFIEYANTKPMITSYRMPLEQYVDSKKLANDIQYFTKDEIIQAIDNYNKCLEDGRRVPIYKDSASFLTKGISGFIDESKPFDKFSLTKTSASTELDDSFFDQFDD